MSGCVKANRGNPLFLPVTSGRAVQTVCMQIFEQHLCFLLLRTIYLNDEQSVLCSSENLLSHAIMDNIDNLKVRLKAIAKLSNANDHTRH